MEVLCPKCNKNFTVTTKKFFHRIPERQGNKVVRCPECGSKLVYNRIFRTIN